MNEIPTPDPDLNEDQRLRVSKLSSEELTRIDETLVSHASKLNRKVAMLVGLSIMDLREDISNIPDVFYAQRIKKIVGKGLLIAEGNLDYMRFSEVRLPEIT